MNKVLDKVVLSWHRTVKQLLAQTQVVAMCLPLADYVPQVQARRDVWITLTCSLCLSRISRMPNT